MSSIFCLCWLPSHTNNDCTIKTMKSEWVYLLCSPRWIFSLMIRGGNEWEFDIFQVQITFPWCLELKFSWKCNVLHELRQNITKQQKILRKIQLYCCGVRYFKRHISGCSYACDFCDIFNGFFWRYLHHLICLLINTLKVMFSVK